MMRVFEIVILLFLLSLSTVVEAEEDKATSSPKGKTRAPEPVFEPPKLAEYVQADYPEGAVARGLEAEVVAELDVDENGLVVGIKILKPAGHGFDEAAEEAMYRFIFAPATKDGTPIPAKVVYRYRFFLQEEAPAPEEAPPPEARLTGMVSDMDGEPIAGASIALSLAEVADSEGLTDEGPAELPEPATTDAQGRFSFNEMIPESYQVDIIAPGYRPLAVTEALVDGERREVTYRLETEESLYETVVRARRPPREVTRREITRREITRIPGTGGDALRSIQNLPGIARAPFASGALIVRGSSPNDSQSFVDYMPIPQLYHFGGGTSVINSDLLESIDFFPGNYGVRYGGSTGGIVEVHPRAPATDRLHAYIDADLFDISALVETPIGEHWSIAASGRRSYIDGILNLVLPDDGGFSFTVAPRYYDYQLIADYHPSAADNLRLFAFGSDDKLVFVFGEDVANNPNFSGGVKFGISFHQLQTQWKHRFDRSLSNIVRLAVGYQGSNSTFGNEFRFDLDSLPIYLRDELEFDKKEKMAFRTGLDASLNYANWAIRFPLVAQAAEGGVRDPFTVGDEIGESESDKFFLRPGWYTELELRPVDELRLISGVRVDYWEWLQELSLDPRVVLRYRLFKGTTLKGGIGLVHQAPEESQSEKPFGNPDIELINAVHYSVGVEQKIIENVEVGLEGFYKDISNLVVVSDGMVERNGELVPEQYNNDGTGRVYGLELLLKHQPTDRFFGWISYTLMKSSRIDRPGAEERLFDYDQTHILTVVASAVLGRGWEAGVRFRLVSGNPETPVIDSFYDADSDIYYPISGSVNSNRLPTFHQLDLRIDKKWTWKYLKASVYLDIQNVYNQANPEGYQHNFDFTERRYFIGLPVIPSFGMKLEY